MADSLFSPSWYRVAALQPRLRGHAQIHRHHYRGERWYVLQDRLSGRYHRFTPATHYLLALMDGQRTVQHIWDMAVEHLGDDAPTQDEMIRLLGQLHAGDLLLSDSSPDSFELFERFQKQDRQKWMQRLMSPLSLKFPLLDPEPFLERWKFVVQPLFSWVGVVLWLAVVVPAIVLAASQWADLTRDVSDRVLAPGNLVTLFLVYPVIKALHELGHGFATKIWGGEVHEMGILMSVFMPIPYVDASNASAFRERYKRALVSAAGILVELFLAAIAVYVWQHVEPGAVRAVAYNVMLIGGISTLLFNGNPLLRFDGYYILADILEIPNLASRANTYLGYLARHYAFGVAEERSPVAAPGERTWFVVYGIAAVCYRLFITISILLFVAGKLFVLGVLMAIWAVVAMFLVPVGKGIQFLLNNPQLERQRGRALATTLGAIAVLLGALFLLPAPLRTRAEGVVWLPEEANVRAGTDGFIRRIVMSPNSYVQPGDALIETEDPLLFPRLRVLELHLQELEAQYLAKIKDKFTEAQMLKDEMTATSAELVREQVRAEKLIIRSPTEGWLVIPHVEDLLDRRVRQGELVAYVVQYPVTTVRVVVTQDAIGLVRQRVFDVQVRSAERVSEVLPARIRRQVPGASKVLPSAVLGESGGGRVALDPLDKEGKKAFEALFQFDLELLQETDLKNIGERVYVRFDHGYEPLAHQWYRKIRQLFLRRFNV